MIIRFVVLSLVGSGVALMASCSPCVSGRPADAIPKVTLADGGLGNACETSSQCSAGLECRDAFFVSETNAETATFKACTRDCATAPCPAGFLCADARGGTASDGGNILQCVPGCQTNADCSTGQRAGTCAVAADAGPVADGGSVTGVCQPTVCGGWNGGSCPTTYLCQDDRYGSKGCNTSGSGAMAAPQPSWCGKLN